MSELIDREALRLAKVPYDEQLSMYERGWNDACDAIADNAPPAPRWVRCEERLPDDGEWAIFTNRKVVTVERFKSDAYDHFYPPSQWFDFDDAKYWMKLPEIPTEEIS